LLVYNKVAAILYGNPCMKKNNLIRKHLATICQRHKHAHAMLKQPDEMIYGKIKESSAKVFFVKSKGSPYSITERRVPDLIPVLGSQPAGDMSRKPGNKLLLLSAKPAVTPATLKRAATDFAAW